MIPIKPRRILAWVLFCSLRTQTYLRVSRVRPILLNMLSLRSTNNNNNIFYLNTVCFKVNIAYGAVCFWRFEYSQTTRKLFRDSIIATYLCIRAIKGTLTDCVTGPKCAGVWYPLPYINSKKSEVSRVGFRSIWSILHHWRRKHFFLILDTQLEKLTGK